MDRDSVLKLLKIFTIGFIALLLLELIDLFLFGNIIITLESEDIVLSRLLFSSEFLSFTDSSVYILLVITSFLFLALSTFLLKLILKGNMENIRLSKIILMIGLLLLVGNFVKLEYIFFLSNSNIIYPLSESYTFIQIIYDHSITPLFGAIMWFYLTIVSACLILSGLVFGAVGLQWFLKLENELKKVQK